MTESNAHLDQAGLRRELAAEVERLATAIEARLTPVSGQPPAGTTATKERPASA
ncbi:MAG TPA: hypothetical protein VGC72_09095 [Candidatus Elarobacter sp.]|jgi:hypothetical protein